MKTNHPSHEQIGQRAHDLWQERGRPEGQDTEIWLEAERQLATRVDAQNSASSPKGRGNGNSQHAAEGKDLVAAAPVPPGASPGVGTPSGHSPDETIAQAVQRKKEARAPQVPTKAAPKPTPPESGKPLWDKPHSS